MLPSRFTVSGYDGGARAQLPVLEVWMRFGARGDNIRWERVQFAVLSSEQYKLLIGMDMLKPREGRVLAGEGKLLLRRGGM